jgi:four helix bundle protein
MQDFRKLRVWRQATSLAIQTRRVASRFPRTGYAELRNQLISAAESVVANIVEGCGASTQREFARFLDIAIKSATEVEGYYELGAKYGIIAPSEANARIADVVQVRSGLFRLRERVLASPDREPSGSISHLRRTPTTHNPGHQWRGGSDVQCERALKLTPLSTLQKRQ